MKALSPGLLRLLVAANALLLAFGLFGPAMVLQPGAGPLRPIVSLLAPESLNPTTHSVFSGIWSLIRGGSPVLGSLVLLLSVVFPVAKLCVYWHQTMVVETTTLSTWAAHLGRYSMADVLVVAILILALKGLPGDSTLTLRWAMACFTAAALLAPITGELISAAARKP